MYLRRHVLGTTSKAKTISVALCAGSLLALFSISSPILAAETLSAAEAALFAPKINQLARDVERASSIRTIKQLQYVYSQYAEFGMWDEMAALFSDKAEAIYGNDALRGRENIGRYLQEKFGGGKTGLPPGGLHTQLFMAPVVTLSTDGKSAQGRWTELSMLGRYGEKAEWAGGMEVNDYVMEGDTWKIAKLHYYAQFAGPYATGWFSLTPDTPVVPYHYTASQAGRPVPDEASDAIQAASKQSLAEIERRIASMNDEDQVRNLQNIYGYYADRKMWDDVTDLFSSDGAFEIAGVGIYEGVKGIRRALERDGPAGLRTGQVHDQIQLHTIVTMDPNGIEARARGLQLGMLTPKLGEAYWSVSVFENRYLKQNGIWRIREMRIYPKMKADYYQGWGKSSIVDPAPARQFAPDRPSPASNAPQTASVIPVFDFPNPATGKAVGYPAGFRIVGAERLVQAPGAAVESSVQGNLNVRLAEAQRKLAVSKAYDAVENISSTFGYYLDDSLWDQFVENMAENGTRPQGAGFYVGREHLYRAMMQSHTAPWSPTNPIDGIRLHLRIQPVIDITPDAKSAFIRTRMFLYYANTKKAGGWNSGMYPNDTAVLENGVWKMKVGGVIDETYFNSPSYEEGWAKPRAGRRNVAPEEGSAPASGPTAGTQGGVARRNGGTIDFPPDIPWTLFDDYRRKDFRTTNWPEIKPMWFHYRNPVSGRVPPNYCPDILTCYKY